MPYTDLSLRLTGRTNLPVLPNHVDIDLTNVCNQDCFYCNSADFRAKNLVTGRTNQYLNLLDLLETLTLQEEVNLLCINTLAQ